MIIVKIMGGLGNQLFQYALAKHLALKNNTELKLDISGFDKFNQRKLQLQHFNTYINIANNDELPYQKRKGTLSKKISRIYDKLFSSIEIKYEQNLEFNPAVLDYRDNIYLEGYWQSENYFKAIEQIIRKEFTVKSTLNLEQKKTADLIKKYSSISIHVRRGDYINHPVHPTCNMEYYKMAVSVLSNNVPDPHFFIFSDDPEWCKTNFYIPQKHYFVSANPPWADFKLMTMCKHHIIANSTFSWWSAYLNSNAAKTIIAPKKWFNDNNKGMVSKDILPKEWMKL